MCGKIVVIGSSNTDLVIRVPRIPRPGETIIGSAFSTMQGGKGANQAIAARKAGADVTFIARVGDDSLGHAALAAYHECGLDTSAIILDANHPTGVALINVSEEGENSISVALGANGSLSSLDIDLFKSHILKADVLLMQLETPLETVVYAAKIAQNHHIKVILNPAPAAFLPDELFQNIDVITPNETETELLTGIKPDSDSAIAMACQVFKNKGVKTVIITLGSKGVYHSYFGFIDAYNVDVVDTTAAGDVFNGALAAATASGMPIRRSLSFANAAAALSVQKEGAQSSIPLLDEIQSFMQKIDF